MLALGSFGVEKAKIVYSEDNNHSKTFSLAISKDATKQEEIAAKIISNYLEEFILKHGEECLSKIKTRVLAAGFSLQDSKAGGLIMESLEDLFFKHIKEYEIEVLCDIEREKSIYYVNKFQDINILKVAI